jgi:capsular polysaccharide biosynthesis protein
MPVNAANNFSDSYKVAVFLYKWRKALLILCVAAAVLSAFFSSPLFVTPMFKSTVIMYPAASNSVSKLLLNDNTTIKQDMLAFGADEQIQQMLQILNSNRIKDKVIQRFKVAEHYSIKPGDDYFQTNLYNRFRSNITFKLTEYQAVKITVLDNDPQLAADIANGIAAILDSVRNDIQKERAVQGFKIVEAEYLSQQKQVQAMEDSLTRIMKLGVNDYESQAEMLNRQYAIEVANGNTRGINALAEKLKILSQYGGPYISLRDAVLLEKTQLSFIKARYEEAKIDAYSTMPQKFIVESAIKAERKSFPVIWIVVVLSTLATLLAAILVIILVERAPGFLRKLKHAEN